MPPILKALRLVYSNFEYDVNCKKIQINQEDYGYFSEKNSPPKADGRDDILKGKVIYLASVLR